MSETPSAALAAVAAEVGAVRKDGRNHKEHQVNTNLAFTSLARIVADAQKA